MPGPELTMNEQNRLIAEAVRRDEPRLRTFIHRRVADIGDEEDVLQEVFSELVLMYRMMRPAEEMTAWLYRVARNRITDLFRSRKFRSLSEPVADDEDSRALEELLPSRDAGPDAEFARGVVLEALEDAIAELPANQREVFLAHEVMGKSFKEISEDTGVSINTLLSRKRYAVLHLRERLKEIYEEYGK